MKNRKNSAWNSFISAMSMPEQYNSKQSHIVVSGREELLVDQAVGILEYSEDCVRIRLKQGVLQVLGETLRIDVYTEKNIVICGRLQTISFE